MYELGLKVNWYFFKKVLDYIGNLILWLNKLWNLLISIYVEVILCRLIVIIYIIDID